MLLNYNNNPVHQYVGPCLQPLSLHQALEASDGSAGGIEDDLSQRCDLQGGVCTLCAVDQHRRLLPDTSRLGHGR